jgi:hypothetical protein
MSTTLVEKQQALDAARKEAAEFYAANDTDKIAADSDLLDKSKQHSRKMADLHDEVAKLAEIEAAKQSAGETRESAGRTSKSEQPTAKGDFDADAAWEQSEGLAATRRSTPFSSSPP